MKQFPHGFIRSIGGVVSARSVKLLDQINNPDEPETRDAWWTELRKEIRSHTRSLSCNVVLGYIETTNICDEVAILSASGTAVLLNPVADRELSSGARHADKRDPGSGKVSADSVDEPLSKQDCKLCHIPYSEVSVPFQAQLIKCAMCRRFKVPDILFMTIEPPPGMPVTGKSCLIQARVCRNKKDLKGEQNAREISDSLPFLEFELHRQILSKLKLKNLNVIFGLKVQVSVGERVIAGIATGTGACLAALPLPSSPLPKLVSGRKDQFVSEHNGKDSDTSEDERDGGDGGLPAKRGACIVQLDDAEDAVSLLREPHMPEGFAMCNTELMPGLDGFSCNLQLFMQTYRAKLFPGIHPSRILSQHFDHIIQSLFVKLRKLVPCCLASLSFHIELPDQDELQVAVLGTAVGLEDGVMDVRATTRTASAKKKIGASLYWDFKGMVALLDEDEERQDTHSARVCLVSSSVSWGGRPVQELCRERHGVDLTSLDHVPGGKTEKYLGNLDFFFIRESTGIREEKVNSHAVLRSFVLCLQTLYSTQEELNARYKLASPITIVTVCLHSPFWYHAHSHVYGLLTGNICDEVKIFLKTIIYRKATSLCSCLAQKNKGDVRVYYKLDKTFKKIEGPFFLMRNMLFDWLLLVTHLCNRRASHDSCVFHPGPSPVGNVESPVPRLPSSCKVGRCSGFLHGPFDGLTFSPPQEGGLNGFVQGFMTEILAIVRAHVSSLGGNAVVAFRMTQCVLLHNPHKNQVTALL
ncbi:unnamed protein product, partial [Ixodes pacificus]